MEATMRHLTRSKNNRVFAGVCGGLAEYLGWDAVVVRIAYVALTLLTFGTAGVILYLLAWLIIPLGGDEAPAGILEERPSRTRARTAVGVLLIIVGALAMIDSFMPWFMHFFAFHVTASILLVLVGLALIFWQKEETPMPVTTTEPGTSAPHEVPRPPAQRLMRIHQGRKIAGVCAGLGKFFNLDPTIVRLLFLVLFFAGGSGLLLYIILWVVMPLENV